MKNKVKFIIFMLILTLLILGVTMVAIFMKEDIKVSGVFNGEGKVYEAGTTNYEEFVKSDGTKYNFTPNVQTVSDLDEAEVLYGSYQFNYTGASSIVSTILRDSSITVTDQWYSKLSTLDGYEWLSQFEDDSLYTSIKDSSGNQLVRGSSSGGELKQYNSGDKIYKAYLVLAERTLDGDTRLLNDYPITLVGPNGKYIETKMENIRSAGKERYAAYMDVTEFVQDQGYGWYYCCNVPYYYSGSFSSDQYSSWKLILIEENSSLPLRALTLKLGYKTTTSSGESVSVAINSKDIKTKSDGEVTGQILYSLEGADINPGDNVLTLSVDGTTQTDFYKETGSTSVLRTDVVPVIERLTRNGSEIINNLMSFDSEANSIANYTGRTYTYNSKTYTLKGNMQGSDVDLLEIDGNKTNTNLTIGNSKSSIGFNFTTYDCVLQANALGLVVDIEGTDYDNEINTEVNKDSTEQEVTVTGTSSNIYGNNDSGLYETATTILLDNDLIVDENKVVVTAYYQKGEGTEQIAIPASDITINGNEIKIAWGEDVNGVTDLTLYGYTLTYEITGLTVGNYKNQYENGVSVTGKLYSSGTATDKEVGDLAKEESVLEYGSIIVEKNWLDDSNSQNTRPDSIEVELYRDGTDSPIATYEIETDKTANVQTYEISNLLMKEDSNTYTYSIKEKDVSAINGDDYASTLEGTKITNLLTGTTSKKADIKWDDKDNSNSTRPDQVIVEVMQNGTKFEEYILDVENENSYTFENLPKYDENGKLYEYTVGLSDEITGYTTTVNGSEITNTLNEIGYTVEYYYDDVKDDSKTENKISHYKDTIENYEDKVIEGYELEKVETIPTVIDAEDIVIKVSYIKRTDLEYTVKYLEQGTNEILADEKLVENQTYKSTAKESAIDISGYDKVDPTTSEITIEVENNEIIFYYTKRTDLEYTVKYLEKDTNEVLADEKVVENQTYKSTVKESAIDISGYDKVDPTTSEITIEVENNEIIFYYTKRTDLEYTVKYLEKDTNEVLADEKVVENQTYKSTAKETAIDISGYDKVNPVESTITIEVENNEIIFYYTKRTDLSYTIKYIDPETREKIKEETVVNGQTYGETVKEEAPEISGYVATKSEETVEITTGENIITFEYTKRTDLSYTVKYLEQGTNEILADEKVVNGQTYKSTVKETAIDISGYDKVDPAESTITIEVENNEITFYYTKRTDLEYTVKYLEQETNEVLADEKVITGQTYKSTAKESAIDISGYDKVNPTESTITIEVENNEITFYYTKRTDLSYTVKYLEQGTNEILADEKVVNGQTYKSTVKEFAIEISGYDKVDSAESTITIEVTGNEIVFYYTKRTDLSYTVKYLEQETNKVLLNEKVIGNQIFKSEVIEKAIDIDGYNKVEPSISKITIEVEDNEIIFYYTKKTDLTYTIEYYYNEVFDSTKTETHTATFLDEIDIYTDKCTDGYKFGREENFPMIVSADSTKNVIKVYYVVDDGQTKELNYTVEYYKEGIKQDEDTQVVKKTVQLLKPNTLSVDKNQINISNKYVGYRLEKADIPDTVNSGDVIKVYYVRDDFNYTVEYYYDEKIDERKTDTFSAKYQDVIETYNDKNITGYTLNRVENIPLTICELSQLNVIKVYYEKDKFEYTVNYYYANVKDDSATEVLKDTFGNKITSYKDKVKYGYEFDKVEGLPLTITENSAQNINVYYKTKDAKIEVKYVDKVTREELAETVTVNGKVFEQHNLSENKKEITGYTLTGEPDSLVLEFKEEVQTVVFEYSKNTEVIVKYLEKDETPAELSDNKVLAEVTRISGYEGKEYTTTEKNIGNYTFVESTMNTEGTMTRDAIEVIYFYAQNTKVVVNHIDQNSGKILDTVEQNGKVGDGYTSESKDIESYVLVVRPSAESGIMTKDIITLNYYYAHVSAGVIEKHIDVKSNEILENIIHEGNEGDTYTTFEKKFEGYDIVKEMLPENATGQMSVDTIEVKYYYIRKTTVKVEYFDRVTNTEIPTVNDSNREYISGHEGDSYTTTLRNFEGYELEKDVDGNNKLPENYQGAMTVTTDSNKNVETETVVRYYYYRKAQVIEKHIDVKSGKLIEKATIYSGYETKPYETSSKEFEGYDLVEEKYPENTIGQMTIEPIEVTYYYIRKTKVIVEYIDMITGKTIPELIESENSEVLEEKDSTEVFEGYEGDTYEASVKTFNNYVLVEEKYPTNEKGTMNVSANETTTYVRYYYVHISAGVREEHIDVMTGKIIEEPILHQGNEGDTYSINSKTFEKYDIVKEKIPENQTGTMTIEETVVRYYYIRKAKVIVKYLEAGTNKVISEEVIINGHEGDNYNAQNKSIDGYDFISVTENAKGKMTTEDIIVIYSYAGRAGVPQSSQSNKPESKNTNTNNGLSTGDNTPTYCMSIIILVVLANTIQIKSMKTAIKPKRRHLKKNNIKPKRRHILKGKYEK